MEKAQTQHSKELLRLENPEVIEKVKEFLPKLKEANEKLKCGVDVNIEQHNVDDTDNDTIEMNFALVQCDAESNSEISSSSDFISSTDDDDDDEKMSGEKSQKRMLHECIIRPKKKTSFLRK